MTRWLPLTLLMALLACSSGSHGVLEPLGGPGGTITSTHGHANDTARLSDGGVTADIIDSWGVKVESLDVTYLRGGGRTDTHRPRLDIEAEGAGGSR